MASFLFSFELFFGRPRWLENEMPRASPALVFSAEQELEAEKLHSGQVFVPRSSAGWAAWILHKALSDRSHSFCSSSSFFFASCWHRDREMCGQPG
jgi:hypothetical protein